MSTKSVPCHYCGGAGALVNPDYHKCTVDYYHPYRDERCDEGCPDWKSCSRGFEIDYPVCDGRGLLEIDTSTSHRIISYYDLIELPSGKHIPAPVAIKLVGLEEVLKIPVSDKKRHGGFYFCEKCYETCQKCDEHYDIDCDYECDTRPYSFFRCTLHKPISEEETRRKETLSRILTELGYHEFMKYVEVDDSWFERSVFKGWIEVDEGGNFVRGKFPVGVLHSEKDLKGDTQC